MSGKHFLISVFIICIINVNDACPPQCNNGCTQTTANCQQSGLRDVPQNFPEETIVIDLSGNQLTELSERTFSPLPSVESLRLSNNGFSYVEDRAFQNVPMLMSLDLSSNPIISISTNAFQGMTKIRSITLSSNKLELIGDGLQNLTSLGSLYAPFNRLREIRENDFANNVQLRMLDLSYNQIARIHPNAFKNLEMLRYLNLNNNPLQVVKGLQFSSSVLQSVDFSMCQLVSVPTKMPSSVRDFRMGNNKIKTLEETDFEGMINLKLLTLNDNEIKNISYRALKALDNLSVLWLNRNQLYYIPQGMPKNLQKLQLDYNQIYEVQDMAFSEILNVDTIALDMNQIKIIDANAFTNLQKLTSFSAQGNLISEIKSGTFSDLSSLQEIQLSDNPISILESRSFNNLPNLTSLQLSHIKTSISGIPNDFLSAVSNVHTINLMDSPELAAMFLRDLQMVLPGIKNLHLEFNNLKSLPRNLHTLLPNLEKLSVGGNSFHCDTKMIGLKQWLHRNPMLLNGEQVTCETPKQLQNRDIALIAQTDFVDGATPSRTDVAAVSGDRNTARPLESNAPDLRGSTSFNHLSSSDVSQSGSSATRNGERKPNAARKGKKGGKRKGKKKGRRNKGKRRGKRNHKGKRRQRKLRRLRRKIPRKRKCVTLPDGGLRCRGARRKGWKNRKTGTTPETSTPTSA